MKDKKRICQLCRKEMHGSCHGEKIKNKHYPMHKKCKDKILLGMIDVVRTGYCLSLVRDVYPVDNVKEMLEFAYDRGVNKLPLNVEVYRG